MTEHAGHVSARRTDEGNCRFEMLLPGWTGQPPATRTGAPHAPAILLIDGRDQVRGQLHNFFEAQGYNLVEAADWNEALAIGEVHEGPLDLVIAEETQEDSISAGIRRTHPRAEFLKIVDRDETGALEIRRPFTQQTLLDRVQRLLEAMDTSKSAAAS